MAYRPVTGGLSSLAPFQLPPPGTDVGSILWGRKDAIASVLPQAGSGTRDTLSLASLQESLRQAEDKWENNLRQQFAYILALQEYIAALHQEVARLKSQVEYFAREGRMVVPVNLAATAREEAGNPGHSASPMPAASLVRNVSLPPTASSGSTSRLPAKRAHQAHCPQCGDRHSRRSACKPDRVARHQAWRQGNRADLRDRLQSNRRW